MVITFFLKCDILDWFIVCFKNMVLWKEKYIRISHIIYV